jgi:hypothetical protein
MQPLSLAPSGQMSHFEDTVAVTVTVAVAVAVTVTVTVTVMFSPHYFITLHCREP